MRLVRCDLSNTDDLSNLFSLIETQRPDIRLLINNAGIGNMGASMEFSDDDILKEIDINCKAVCLMCNHVIPFMSEGSRILNISSASSFQPVPYINLYAAGKAFVRSYTRSLNAELKPKGIVCTAVCCAASYLLDGLWLIRWLVGFALGVYCVIRILKRRSIF